MEEEKNTWNTLLLFLRENTLLLFLREKKGDTPKHDTMTMSDVCGQVLYQIEKKDNNNK